MQDLLPGTESISEDPFGKGSTRLEGGLQQSSPSADVSGRQAGRNGGKEGGLCPRISVC